ncbi:hypothetical protein BDZ45DRAFT_34306 [Acephala macrosclerotiorum]|nr:hypothetical protein BDZ45DRAFT_34306 [Acephala macrosclerotiorum]
MSRQPYLYFALNKATQEIRLLTIHPGAFDSELRLSLETVSFPKDSDLQFEALSYAWGSLENAVEIVAEGIQSHGTIAITRNLADALPYLRRKDTARVIWVDAICVNQQDLTERSSQVKRMADIYSSALRVIVWLGPESHDTALAIKCCETISENIAVDWGLQNMSALSTETHWADPEEFLPFDKEELTAVSSLLNRDWFKRLWIWQEVSLAQDVVVLCGIRSLHWTRIRDAVFNIYWKPWPVDVTPELISRPHELLLYRLCRGLGTSKLHELLENTKYSLCSDARDKIFALLSLLHGQEQNIKIEPDYSKPLSRIYQDFVQNYIEKQKHLRMLSAIEVQDHLFASPSWVPDWSSPRLTTHFGKLRASGSSTASASFEVNGCLRVLGLTIGTIETTEPFRFPTTGSRMFPVLKLALELERVARVCNVKDLVMEDAGILLDLSRVLCANKVAELYSPPHLNFPSLQDAEHSLREMLSCTIEECEGLTSTSVNLFARQVFYTCYGRSLFKCLDGTIGIVPQGVKPGDKVVVWLGCDSAMALRSVWDNWYRPLGEAIYGGAMDGSAFLGILPERFELVRRYFEAHKGEIWVFFDKKSGIFSTEDPRLKDVKLPSGWRKSTRPDSPEVRFVNEETGVDTWHDPRFTAESLTSRGTILETFELV